MSSHTPTVEQLKRAVAIAEQIKSLEAEVASILGGQMVAPLQVKRGPGAPRKVILDAPVSEAAPAPAKARKRKKLSPEGLAAIVAAQKARWARHKKALIAAGGDKGKK